jgi:ferredoxin, 2Fe-2S
VTFIQCDGSKQEVAAGEGTTLMRAAVENSVDGILGTCGGSLSCATCHVYLDDAWLSRAGNRGDEEEVLLEFVPDARPNSRLSCQIVLEPVLDGLVAYVPEVQSAA